MNGIITRERAEAAAVGTKAERLFRMQAAGLCVPAFFCVQEGFDEAALNEYLRAAFPDVTEFSVRSSASCEDGTAHSFAGQFETYLHVEKSQAAQYVRRCLQSADAERLQAYFARTNTAPQDVTVTAIVQEMLHPTLSGVMFTANPQGILNETVIAVGRGTGDNVVEDKTAVTQYFFNRTDGVYYCERQGDSPTLTDVLLRGLIAAGERITALFGENQDIEFAVQDGAVFVLQARPITSLPASAAPIILDSSNISESYPGVSLPMTVSFVQEVYYQVFRSCIRRLTMDDGTAERLEDVLQHMTDAANGRIYYRISGWYDVILLLPFSRRIIPVWQEMLGVREKQVSITSEQARLSTKLRVLVMFFRLLLTNRREMRRLNAYFQEVYRNCSDRLRRASDAAELLAVYEELKQALASQWDLTLVNDMYAFIYTGLLKASLRKRQPAHADELTNLYISGIAGIESMKPPTLLYQIRQTLETAGKLDALQAVTDAAQMHRFIAESGAAGEQIAEYLARYGDRCPCELKLETKTCRTNPELLVPLILHAQKPAAPAHTAQKPPRGLAGMWAKRAAAGIALREQSRLSRGQIFGLVREIILSAADILTAAGRLDDRDDVFYLTFEELQAAVHRQEPLQSLVSERKRRTECFRMLPAYSRLMFAERVFDKNPVNVNAAVMQETDDVMRGIPCSAGTAEGEVLLVENIRADLNAEGKIIVARMTDPGWVFLLSQAAGIISEKGSLLSHTAIISRELKKPAVVGAANVCSRLRSGDVVRVNGADGEIRILRRKQDAGV